MHLIAEVKSAGGVILPEMADWLGGNNGNLAVHHDQSVRHIVYGLKDNEGFYGQATDYGGVYLGFIEYTRTNPEVPAHERVLITPDLLDQRIQLNRIFFSTRAGWFARGVCFSNRELARAFFTQPHIVPLLKEGGFKCLAADYRFLMTQLDMERLRTDQPGRDFKPPSLLN